MIDKVLQDLVWSVLPKEFKKEVKKLHVDAISITYSAHDPDDRKWGNYRSSLLEKLFGINNLISDAEGEEMLMCDRDVVRMLYDRADSVKVRQTLESLFGSKCLPDESNLSESLTGSEPKPSIPKFKHKLGDKVRIVNDWSCGYKHNGEVTEIVAIDESDPEVPYKVDIYDEEEGGDLWYQESDLEPYTEPILQPFSQVKETAASTISITEFDKLSKLKEALLKLEEASKQVREELTKLNEI